MTRKRPQANQPVASVFTTTITQYDVLNRPLSVTYADGNTAFGGYIPTPAKTYVYDQTVAFGNSNVGLGSSKGRLTREFVTAGNGAGEVFGYDALGRVTLEGTCRPTTCGTSADWMNYSYDLAGNMLTSTDGNNITTTYTYTAASELKTATSSRSDSQDPAALISSVQQSVFGPTSFQLGNGVKAVNSYDTMGRWNGRWVCKGSTSVNCSGGTQLDGTAVTWQGTRATAMTDTAAGKTYTYGYDGFNRLTSNTGGSQNYTYSYDLFGNRLSQTPGPNISFNTTSTNNTNQMVGFQYDAAGNLLKDAAGNQYTYDAEGNVIQVGGTSSGTLKYTYDALNHRVRVDKGSTYQEYDFNVAGQRVSIWNGTTNLQGQYYAGTRPIAYYKGGSIHFQHQDWLGSERIRTTYNGAVEGQFTQLAFGDSYQTVSGTDTDDAHYASLDYDSATQTSHAQFRELDSIHGRWMSADPYDGSYDASNPQSFNRYAYVLNNPLGFSDPSGLAYVWQGPCLYYVQNAYVDGVYNSTDSYLIYCNGDPGGVNVNGGGGGVQAAQPSPAPAPNNAQQQIAKQINTVNNCTSQANAAMNAGPSVAPTGQNVIDGVVAATFTIATDGAATVLSVLTNFFKGSAVRSAGHAAQNGATFLTTYHGCLAAAGQGSPYNPYSPF